jgi:hypothetical protein
MTATMNWEDLKIHNPAVLRAFPEQQGELVNKFKLLTSFVQNARHNLFAARTMALTLNDPGNLKVWDKFTDETAACIIASLEEAMELPNSARLYPLNSLWGVSRDVAEGLGNWPELKKAVHYSQAKAETLDEVKEQPLEKDPALER